MAFCVEKLLLAAPRGYCAGVDRAVQTVERALELHGAPVYVRKEIVHNKHVVERCASAARSSSTSSTTRSPRARSPSSPPTACRRRSTPTPRRGRCDDRRDLPARDQGPPSRRMKFAADGYTIVLIGHGGHEEVEGTMGEAPDAHRPRRDRGRRRTLEVADPTRSPTSRRRRCRSTRRADHRPPARARSPRSRAAHRRHLLRDDEPPGGGQADGPDCDLVLVIGSHNSSNSNRLVDVARDHGADSYLIDNESQVQDEWLDGSGSSASPPARAPPRSSSSASSTSSAPAATATWRSSRSSARTCASCCPRRIRQGLAATEPGARVAAPTMRTLVISDLHLGTHGVPTCSRRRRRATRCSSASTASTGSSCSVTPSSCVTDRPRRARARRADPAEIGDALDRPRGRHRPRQPRPRDRGRWLDTRAPRGPNRSPPRARRRRRASDRRHLAGFLSQADVSSPTPAVAA